MHMILNKDEVAAILKKHIVSDWGVPENSIGQIEFFVETNDKNEKCLVTKISIKTTNGGPYREKA